MSMDFEEVLQSYFSADTVEEMEIDRIEGDLYRITAHLKEGNMFTFTDEINWGKTIIEFNDTLDRFTGGYTYTFNGFDPEAEIVRYGEAVANFYGDY
jgi:hypothetical protein